MKITEKIKLEDVEVQSDHCKAYWTEEGKRGRFDCKKDCYEFTSPYLSIRY
ncbi:hypothetical protein [Romboutsia sp. MSSM.1001216sp_RTP31141st1_G3_RTP31141_220114]|uniref:hypothetical protein n=1 Tax=unclassified Romboutsia TaxID=2626894 RepID=UPI0031B5F323